MSGTGGRRVCSGWWHSPSPVRVVDYAESAQVFRVPVRDLLDPDNRVMATVRRAGGAVSVRSMSPQLLKLFEITGISRMFPVD